MLNRVARRRGPRGWEGWPAAGTRRCAGAESVPFRAERPAWPWRANMVAAVLPPGPPPMTITRLTRISFRDWCPRDTLRAGTACYASSHGLVPPSSLVTIAAASLSADPYSTTWRGRYLAEDEDGEEQVGQLLGAVGRSADQAHGQQFGPLEVGVEVVPVGEGGDDVVEGLGQVGRGSGGEAGQDGVGGDRHVREPFHQIAEPSGRTGQLVETPVIDRHRRVAGEPVLDRPVGLPHREHDTRGWRVRIALPDLDRAVHVPRQPGALEHDDVVADDRRSRAREAKVLGEATKVRAGDFERGEAVLGGPAQAEQDRSDPVGSALGVPNDVAGMGQRTEDAEAGGLGDVETPGQLGDGEALAGIGRQEIEHPDHPLGRGRLALGSRPPADRCRAGSRTGSRAERFLPGAVRAEPWAQ